jgi:amidophosphoribosyltransferase
VCSSDLIDMRSFIQATDDERTNIVDQKFLPILTRIRGQRILLFEDSIVRGNTLRRLINYLRTFHPLEIHVGSYFPQYQHLCPNGIDTATREELIAYREQGDPERIARYIGADSVHYLSLDSMFDAINVNPRKVCIGCHTGVYPNDRGTVQEYVSIRQKERKNSS